MGFLAVVQPDSLLAAGRVTRLHANLWCLPGLLGEVFYFDVGVGLRATTAEISRFDLVVPVRTERQSLVDLTDKLRTRDVAELIFGGSVTLTNDRVSYGGREMELVSTRPTGCAIHGASDAFLSHWTIELSQPIAVGAEGYTRVRFHALGTGRVWRWQRGRRHAVVDFRVCDVRETVGLQDARWFRSHMLPVEELSVFVVAPSPLLLRNIFPQPTYVRALEGDEWVGYLERAPSWRPSKMLIYQWKEGAVGPSPNDTTGPAYTPFRGFLDLEATRHHTTRTFAATAAAVVVGLLLGLDPSLTAHSAARSVVEATWRWVGDQVAVTLAGGAVAAVFTLVARVRSIRDHFPGVRRSLRRVERAVFGLVGRRFG